MKTQLKAVAGQEVAANATRAVDSCALATVLRGTTSESRPADEQLYLLASAGLASQLDDLATQLQSEEVVASPAAAQAFRAWLAYVDTADRDVDSRSDPEDLLCLIASGLLARRPTEARTAVRRRLDRLSDAPTEWSLRVRHEVSIALVYLFAQRNHDDLRKSEAIVAQLGERQAESERRWLEDKEARPASAAALLGLYHLAHAVKRLALYLWKGGDQEIGFTNFSLELRRLLIRAEEYLQLTADPALTIWLNGAGLVAWHLYLDSIWTRGSGVSKAVDDFLSELASEARSNPIFSLLPSQQDALAKSLLDPTRIAVVLQMPTSSGKTLLAELAIVQTLEAYKEASRIAYVVPTRALVTQTRRALLQDLRPLGIEVAAAGSAFEDDPFEMDLIGGQANVVVLTPEKLDLLLRAHPEWLNELRLVIIDEAHLLQESERGVRLELLLANLRREQPATRLLLLTPFIENAREIATWLGGARSLPVDVHWRPSRLLLGFAAFYKRLAHIEWREPYDPERVPAPTALQLPSAPGASKSARLVALADHFRDAGVILGMFGSSRVAAEKAALTVADTHPTIDMEAMGPALRVAVALAEREYGEDSSLSVCLRRGVTFHHAAVSPILRYLIEDQIKAGNLRFVAATSTLAQGMNFPVSVILVHSVSKPWGKGTFSPSEFWNIAGRAGRVGMADQGLIVFLGKNDRPHWERYSSHLNETLRSALLHFLESGPAFGTIKDLYRDVPECRPFLQYLAHAAAQSEPGGALAHLEEILQGSLAQRQVDGALAAQRLRNVARAYLTLLLNKSKGYLTTSDQTGLGSFSFDELYAKVGADPLLSQGPAAVMGEAVIGLTHLVEALKWLPELQLGLGLGAGPMNSEATARVIDKWLHGASAAEVAYEFKGEPADRIRKAAVYLHSTISHNVAWGAHAYLRAWFMKSGTAPDAITPEDRMLPAYLQHGVLTSEAAVASLLGVPREFAEAVGATYRDQKGPLRPEASAEFKTFIEQADRKVWNAIVTRSRLAGAVDPDDVRAVWRQASGLVQ